MKISEDQRAEIRTAARYLLGIGHGEEIDEDYISATIAVLLGLKDPRKPMGITMYNAFTPQQILPQKQ